MPFSRSRSPESMTRSTTAWLARNVPVWRSIASTSVVLPWSTWATIATLRRSSCGWPVGSAGVAAWAGRVRLRRAVMGRAHCPIGSRPSAGRRGPDGRPATHPARDRRRRDPVRHRRGRPDRDARAGRASAGSRTSPGRAGRCPIVVLSPDPDGAVAAALAGSEATHGDPAPAERGPAGQMIRGIEVAAAEVQRPDRRAASGPRGWSWVGPETITSLIEAHGTDPGTLLRPGLARRAGLAGPPAAGPPRRAATTPPDLMPPAVVERLTATIPSRIIELGDPGVTHRRRHRPRPSCRRTRARPTRRPATPTNGVPASRPKRAWPRPTPSRPDDPS